MNATHDVDDNDEPLFQFDPFDALLAPSTPQLPFDFRMSPARRFPVSDVNSDVDGPVIDTKGKARSTPLPILRQPSMIVRDLFQVSSQTLSSPMSYDSLASSIMISSASTSHRSSLHHSSFNLKGDMEDSYSASESCSSKGKEKASFPMLPPFSFPDINLHHTHLTPSSSSNTFYDHSSPPFPVVSNTPISSPLPNHLSDAGASFSSPPLTHCQSPLTKLSNQAPASPPISLSPFEIPGNISRQLTEVYDNYDGAGSSSSDPASLISTLDLKGLPSEFDNQPLVWYATAKGKPSWEPYKQKRSRSSPYPLSALDIIPDTSTDIFQPLPIVTRNYFDLIIPKELRLHVLSVLVDLHEEDHQRSVLEGRFTVAKATSSRSRWVGRDKGIRELFKLSRVSKSWQALVFDGQLWANLDLYSFPGLSQETITRVVQSSGSFVRKLNFAGHSHLTADTLSCVTIYLCFKNTNQLSNQLTSINLQGCISLTARSLHQLLVRSRGLKSLCLKGLNAVTNTTCDIIYNSCPNLVSLNLSRCVNMDAEGVRSLARSSRIHRNHLKLKELRLSGLKYVSDAMMGDLGQVAPDLEVLDLSYSHLRNSGLEAFVEFNGDSRQTSGVETIFVSARDLGRDGDSSSWMIGRRITQLRHLNLSHCTSLTDVACANIAFSVPKLEFLELAGIGHDLKDEGLVKLLRQTPLIRRLDLEDATEITDEVIGTLTPAPETEEGSGTVAKLKEEPGCFLQYLNISYATNVSDNALLALIRSCKHLTALEVDNTRIGKNVVREFVRICQQRRAVDARIVAIDCRGINEGIVKELSPVTRPRLGFRRYDARKLNYLDAKDENEDELKVGQDECDETKVVIKTFYSWQTVDAVKAVRDKRKKAMSRSESSNGGGSGVEGTGRGSRRKLGYTRWWSPGGRRSRLTTNSGNISPQLSDLHEGGDCVVM